MYSDRETKDKKTVLIATDSFFPRWDGIARFLNEIIPRLAQDYNVVIAAPRFPGNIEGFKYTKLIRFPLSNINIADTTLARVNRKVLKKLVKDSDIVLTQSIGPIGALAMIYAKRYQKTLISYVHSVEWDLFSKSLKRFRKVVEFSSRKLIRLLYNKCTLILVPFEGLIPILEKQSINAPKEIVKLGTNIDRFVPPASKKFAKKNIGLSEDKIVIGYLGRFGREKNIGTLYFAFRKVHKKNKKTTLLLVGGKLDKPFSNMEDVKVFPSVNNPEKYFQAMDIYVLPSLTETTSLTTMEAMSCEVPVVCTPVGYIGKYIEHKVNGYLFPPKNIGRLVIILEKLISNEKERKKIGFKGRKTVIKKYSWNQTAKKILSILDRF